MRLVVQTMEGRFSALMWRVAELFASWTASRARDPSDHSTAILHNCAAVHDSQIGIPSGKPSDLPLHLRLTLSDAKFAAYYRQLDHGSALVAATLLKAVGKSSLVKYRSLNKTARLKQDVQIPQTARQATV